MAVRDPRALTRKDLEQFLPNQRAIRAFEKLFDLVPQEFIEIDERIAELERIKFDESSVDEDYTTTKNEVVICNNTDPITITLNDLPEDLERVKIKRNTGQVTVAGTIDGFLNPSIPATDESWEVIYTDAAGWSRTTYRAPLDNVIRVNRIEDLAVQDASTITFERGRVYEFGNTEDLVTSKRFIFEEDVTITKKSFAATGRIISTTTGAMFTGVDCRNIQIYDHAFSCPNASQIFDISDTDPEVNTLFFVENVRFLADDPSSLISNKFGTFTDIGVISIYNVGCSTDIKGALCLGVNDGITVNGNILVLSFQRFSMASQSATFAGLDYTGALFSAFEISNFLLFSFGVGSRGIVGDEFSANISPGVLATVRDCEFIGGVSTSPLVGITPGDVRYKFSDCDPISDSSTKGVLRFDGSTLETVMSGAGIPTPINAVWRDGEVEERVCFGDKVTFDSTTSTLTTVDGEINTAGGTAFSHNLTNGDSIELLENGGLPAELDVGQRYYIGDTTATTFRLYSDSGLTTLVSFTDNGTEPNYICHQTGNCASGWQIYIGEQNVALNISGWITIEKSSGADSPVRSVIMKTDTDYSITRGSNGSTVSAKINSPNSSQIVDVITRSKGQGFIIYVENGAGSTNNEVTDARVSCIRA